MQREPSVRLLLALQKTLLHLCSTVEGTVMDLLACVHGCCGFPSYQPSLGELRGQTQAGNSSSEWSMPKSSSLNSVACF